MAQVLNALIDSTQEPKLSFLNDRQSSTVGTCMNRPAASRTGHGSSSVVSIGHLVPSYHGRIAVRGFFAIDAPEDVTVSLVGQDF